MRCCSVSPGDRCIWTEPGKDGRTCDIIVSTHPGFTNTMEKQAARTAGSNPFIDPHGCKRYASASRARPDMRIADERAGAVK